MSSTYLCSATPVETLGIATNTINKEGRGTAIKPGENAVEEHRGSERRTDQEKEERSGRSDA